MRSSTASHGDFRGWEGERVWSNNHLVVTAVFGSGGHVSLVLDTSARPLIRRLDVHGDDHDRGRGRDDGSR
ncbi:DUF6228 family protein [Streptomyces sp. NPDC003719]